MHKRTRACQIKPEVREAVEKRDGGRCIFCGAPGRGEAHYIARSHGGLGIEQNILTVCRSCHDKLDNSTKRKEMKAEAKIYLQLIYDNWNEEDLIYKKGLNLIAGTALLYRNLQKNCKNELKNAENAQNTIPDGFQMREDLWDL